MPEISTQAKSKKKKKNVECICKIKYTHPQERVCYTNNKINKLVRRGTKDTPKSMLLRKEHNGKR